MAMTVPGLRIPGLVAIAKEAFDKVMKTPNQIHKKRDDVNVSAKDLLNFQPKGPITEQGLRTNINIGIQYLGAWLAGTGCVPIFNLMEDAATAEISRAQIWHWIRSPHGVLDDGRKVTKELFRELVPQELAKVREMLGDKGYAAGKVSGRREDVRGTDAGRGLRRIPHVARIRIRNCPRASLGVPRIIGRRAFFPIYMKNNKY